MKIKFNTSVTNLFIIFGLFATISCQITFDDKASNNSDLLPTTSQCGKLSEHIYGGTEAALGEFPWMAWIEYTKESGLPGHHCIGSLINNRYVLTAAQCIKKIPKGWSPSAVRLGEHDTTTNPDCEKDFLTDNELCAPPHVDVPIEKTIVHEDYNPTSKNQNHDIALLRLTRTVQYDDYIQPICLPLSSALQNKNLSGVGLAISGWGRTESRQMSTKKKKAIVKGVSLASCNSVYNQKGISLADSQMCAGGDDVGPCNGDSGGPLIGMETTTKPNHFYLAGLVSFGPRICATKGWPDVFTKIAPHIDWIVKNLEP